MREAAMTRFGPPLVTAHSIARPVMPAAANQSNASADLHGQHLHPQQQHQQQQQQHQSANGGMSHTNSFNHTHGYSHPHSPFETTPASSTSSARTLRSLDELEKRALPQSAQMPPLYSPTLWQPREHNVVFGKDVIQVPLKVEDRNNEYVNLVLSHREFDVMAVHIPQYDEMQPTDLIDEITRLVKEQGDKQKNKRHSLLGGNNQIGDHDANAIFQARILELEYELSRLNTKLAAARALQASLTDENTVLRSNLRDMEQRCVDTEKLQLQNELLRDQAVSSFAENGRMKKLLVVAQQQLRSMVRELHHLQLQVVDDHSEIAHKVEQSMHSLVENVHTREHVLQQSYLEEKKERQLIAEKYYEISGRIRVFCRLRPVTRGSPTSALIRPKPNALLVERSGKEFSFDQVFGPESSQADVYAQMEPVVVSFADGYNACIMAYGQTGSGKTFTMVGGSGEHQGMIPRALQQVFTLVSARQLTYKDTLSVSMVEIYNDQILDLLTDVSGVRIKNETDITTRRVTLWEHVNAVLAEGNANRNIASTSMNLESSRSHALVFLHLESQHRETLEMRRSTLCLVDLAGSERISRSQVEGERLKETQHINKSLSALGDVMHALQHKAKHIPYRNSKLTYMLREMLSGQAKTLMMLQLSPEDDDVEETICSLQFGARVSQIQMGAVKTSVESGEIFKLKDENRALERKLEQLDEQLAAWKQNSHTKHDELEGERARNRQLERDLAVLQENVVNLENAAATARSHDGSGGSATGSATSSPPDSPQSGRPPLPLPVSPTLSARSARSVSSTTSAPSASSGPSKAAAARTARTTTTPTTTGTGTGVGGVRPSPRATGTSTSKATKTTTKMTDSAQERAARRRSLTTLNAPASATVLAVRERLARTSVEPFSNANRRATLSGPIGGSSRSNTSASNLASPSESSRIPRPRAPLSGSASPSPSASTGAVPARAAVRRTNSLASTSTTNSSRAIAGATGNRSTPTASSAIATSSLRAPASLEKRRAASARSLPSTPVSTSARTRPTASTMAVTASAASTSSGGWK